MNTQFVYSQLAFCGGNSGDAIFSETFGTGTDYGPQLPVGTTTYNFISSSDPQDGEYTIGSNTFSFDWNLPSDHTPGDTNGKCLIVNASFTPGEFYKTTINGLCENTTYEFSAWVINILPSSGCGGSGIPVNVQFEIWDTTITNLLASGNTGDIFSSATPNWQQYGLVFQTLASQTSVILKMLNNGVGGCGNDLAIDDIVFKSCGDRVVLENTNGSTNFEACEDEMINSVLLSAVPDFSVFSTHAYQWQVSSDELNWSDIVGATTNTYIAPAPVGTFYYRVKFAENVANIQNSSCNSLSDVFEVRINSIKIPTFNEVGPICNGDSLAALPTTSTNNITGSWSPAINNSTTTIYTFTPNDGECATKQTLTIIVNQRITPIFNAVMLICNGDNLTALPTSSSNKISGTWTPALDNTATTTYTFTPDPGQCSNTSTLTVVVNQPPSVDLEDTFLLCAGTNGTEILESPIRIDTNLSTSKYSFEWFNNNNDVIGINAFYLATEEGNYRVVVTDLITGCQSEDSTNVALSSPPIVQAVVTSDSFSVDNTIEVSVTGNGNYEYSLDNGAWQDSPLFSNVPAGDHMVTARDKNGCGFSSVNLCVIGYPKFLTPNGDNYNDTWQIIGTDCLDAAKIYIFDRYGKLLKEISLNSAGWNGTFNGELLPTSDYWFVISYNETNSSDTKEFKGHFTLKR